MNTSKKSTGAWVPFTLVGLYVAVIVGLWVLGIYAAVHFVMKFW